LRHWTGDRLIQGLARLRAAEALSRRTGAPEALICQWTLRQLGDPDPTPTRPLTPARQSR
jgi:hypothetical protein